jgi:hypothetical protein
MPGHAPPTWHPHAAITQWAVAAGAVGHPVHIVFQDYPAPLIAELYRKHVAWIAKENVFSVFGLSDFHELQSSFNAVRLVLLFDAKQLARTCWFLDIHRNDSEADGRPSPAVFSCQNATAAADIPGATLVLHGYSPQVKSLEAWLQYGPSWSSLPRDLAPTVIRFDHRLSPLVVNQTIDQGEGSLSLRERQILKGLLVGAALVRKIEVNGRDGLVLVELQDYRVVYKALQSTATQPAGQSFDPLVLAMVRRANAYLLMKAQEKESKQARADAPAGVIEDDRAITRREIADLGNTRGKTVEKLLDFLLQQGPVGVRIFGSIGTTRVIKEQGDLPSRDSRELAKLLLSWGPKQTRTRFAFLHSKGLITAEREAANKPWVYELPEALANAASPFRSLPKPDELERGVATV